jgi:RNA polymerase sigma-70 factor, ECF subfamily
MTTRTTTAATATTVTAEGTTASAPSRPRFGGRPDHGAAAARTEELYAQHGRLVAGLCGALLRDRSEAEDAAQQTFLSAHRALLNGSAPTEPAAWLATIARNECWARIKTRMRQPLPAEHIEDERSSSDPVVEAIRNADLAALWSAIAALPKQQRDALLLREFGGLSYTELAVALAATGPAVESLLFRARHGVRARLEAAYAALTGASWLESLARVFGGIGGGMAPVAAKVAVVSVGAAVVTGGYVAAPHVLHTPTRPARPAHTHAPPRSRAAPAAVLVAETRSAGSATAVSTVRSHDSGRHEGSGSGDLRQTESQQAESRRRLVSSDTSERRESGRQSEGTATAEPSDGESSGTSGRDGDGGGDGGGVTTTAPNPSVTVTVPVADQPPAVGEAVPAAGD